MNRFTDTQMERRTEGLIHRLTGRQINLYTTSQINRYTHEHAYCLTKVETDRQTGRDNRQREKKRKNR